MENIFIQAFIIIIIYISFKYIENKLIIQEYSKSIKEYIRDSLLNYISIILGITLYEFLNTFMIMKENNTHPEIFSDDPNF